jgi:hypothetical protein
MAIETIYDAKVVVNSVNLSDHCTQVVVHTGQETKDATCMGQTIRVFRPGLQTISFDCTFKLDALSTSTATTLAGLSGIVASSSGFTVSITKKASAALGVNNPTYSMVGILDGDVTPMNDTIGELAEVSAKFVPFSSFSVSTTTS